MDFTKEQLKELEGRARELKPSLIVAGSGIEENIVWGLSHRWGMVKIQFPTKNRALLLKMAEELAEKTGSQMLFVSGNQVIYYRKHPTKSVDELFK